MENKMNIFTEYHICRTGKLEQFYTLYTTTTVSYGDNFFNQVCSFQQNLSHNEDEAISKVKEMISSSREPDNTFIDFCDSTKKEYCDLKAFGFKWKKTPKGFMANLNKYYIPSYSKDDDIVEAEEHNNLVDNFWRTWREKKSIMKEAGFSVFKADDGFKLFFRNCPNEEMYERMSLLENKYEVQGEFVGGIGERLKDIEVTCEKFIEDEQTHYGYNRVETTTTLRLWFKTEAGEQIFTKYTGKKYVLKDFDTKGILRLSGTVKSHEVRDFVNTTIINRVSIR